MNSSKLCKRNAVRNALKSSVKTVGKGFQKVNPILQKAKAIVKSRNSTLGFIIFYVCINKAVAIPITILVKDLGDIPQKIEQVCTLFCQLAKVGHHFVDTREGKAALMWYFYMSLGQGAKLLGFVAVPVLANGAILITFFAEECMVYQRYLGLIP